MVTIYKPMVPTLVEQIPTGNEWVYEVKFDGYRCLLYWSGEQVHMMSRNLHRLDHLFPEVIQSLSSLQGSHTKLMPMMLDGELCILDSADKANFEEIQIRGRLKNELKIEQASKQTPAQFLAFDVLMIAGVDMKNKPLEERKQHLEQLFSQLNHKRFPALQFIESETNHSSIWNRVKKADGEGIIAKKKTSLWLPGTRTKEWVKIKNWKAAVFILTAYDKINGYFHVSLLHNNELVPLGPFLHGLNDTEKTALIEIIKKNKESESKELIMIKPSICVELQFLELYKQKLRQPRFLRFRFDVNWEDCTWESVQKNELN
ncbi:non-homologous end-joining DNA ligase [Anaerobacillus sp. MEB173]|uniref:non-homologous end-joining DNA ligase n=1 Tax=Anaerobacillus sp. MEB173 TaxID=3383345 RepID=UPI003F8DA09E